MFQDFEYRTAIDFCLFLGISLKEYNKEPDIYVYIFALYITAFLVLAIGVPCLNINNDFSRWVVCMQVCGTYHGVVFYFRSFWSFTSLLRLGLLKSEANDYKFATYIKYFI